MHFLMQKIYTEKRKQCDESNKTSCQNKIHGQRFKKSQMNKSEDRETSLSSTHRETDASATTSGRELNSFSEKSFSHASSLLLSLLVAQTFELVLFSLLVKPPANSCFSSCFEGSLAFQRSRSREQQQENSSKSNSSQREGEQRVRKKKTRETKDTNNEKRKSFFDKSKCSRKE